MPNLAKTNSWVVIIETGDGITAVGGFDSAEEAENWLGKHEVEYDHALLFLPLYDHKGVEDAAIRDEVDESLDELEDKGLIEWCGIADDGEPTFKLTEEGEEYARKITGDGNA